MTAWVCDPPPSPTSSMIVGCLAAGAATVGDFSDCVGECEPPPVVTDDTNTTATTKYAGAF